MYEKRATSAYRHDGDFYLIELELKNLAQLYNSFDPAPFHERDLDDSAADYIREAVEELHGHSRIKLVVHVQETLDASIGSQVSDAIHHYFAYRAHTRRVALRQQLQIGRVSLLVGLLFLGFCIELSTLLDNMPGTAFSILREGFLIIGWVAMWKPLDIFLYSWWPVRSEIRLYDRISQLPVEVNNHLID